MIYTSYFAKLKSLPDNVVPISICGKAPAWYSGLQYKKLAPKYGFFMEWKENHNNEYYIRCYKEQVTDKLNPKFVVEELDNLFLSSVLGIDCKIDSMVVPHIALICYEKPADFCHRHLVADWLNQNGFKCEEYKWEK
ncbi:MULTISPECIES: hypothetical protein [unclassified Lacrimispora]|uniref:hypothetical protein n=1 Tax=unclassified Lacrimispora TaxID=2719232 RepID=UPI00376F9026